MPNTEAWPTEHLATRAVDAAARKAFERYRASAEATKDLDWEDLAPTTHLRFREVVLPVAWAALTSLPDPRYAAWLEGHAAGLADSNRWYDGILDQDAVNPYPAPAAPDFL